MSVFDDLLEAVKKFGPIAYVVWDFVRDSLMLREKKEGESEQKPKMIDEATWLATIRSAREKLEADETSPEKVADLYRKFDEFFGKYLYIAKKVREALAEIDDAEVRQQIIVDWLIVCEDKQQAEYRGLQIAYQNPLANYFIQRQMTEEHWQDVIKPLSWDELQQLHIFLHATLRGQERFQFKRSIGLIINDQDRQRAVAEILAQPDPNSRRQVAITRGWINPNAIWVLTTDFLLSFGDDLWSGEFFNFLNEAESQAYRDRAEMRLRRTHQSFNNRAAVRLLRRILK